MFGHFSYLVYMLIFTLVPIVTFWLKYYPSLIKEIKTILTVTLIGIIYQLVVDPFAESWHAWYFSDDRILGLWLFNFPVENILFFGLVSFAISTAVVSFTQCKK